MNQIVVGDPLFKETEEKGNLHNTMSKFMGINPGEDLDKKRISNAAYYMKSCTFLVASQFIKFLPVSLLNEAPKDLPILYSENNFSDAFPRELYEWFHKNARVHNIEKPLSLGTTIHDEKFELTEDEFAKYYNALKEREKANDRTTTASD